jgi:molecular chaperone HtpG
LTAYDFGDKIGLNLIQREDVMQDKGTISIHAQNIMPIIKKWLYSDKDIFIREVAANASDAIYKRSHIQPEFLGQGRIDIALNENEGWLRISDNGIGMTEEEVKRYINQVAFSSAEEFLKKYEGADNSGIIGHFGLGFYSTFMVSRKVVIDTLSCQDGASAVRWESEDGYTFEIADTEKDSVGTSITMYLQDEEKEFATISRVREVLMKYCQFLPIPIYVTDEGAPKHEEHDEHEHHHEHHHEDGEACDCGHEHHHDDAEELSEEQLAELEKELEKEDELEDAEEASAESKETPINNTQPLWLKNPKDCTEAEYKEFYRKLFHDYDEPLFWVHLNVDHPFRLKGILYFPKLKQDFAGIPQGPIKLFSAQMFVADNIKEVIPEFLTLLKGAIDCPDLPLNVSRSFLQNDGYVKKLSSYITRKVADRLTSLFNNERESYEKYWEDINPFVKFGCMKDEGFFDKVKDVVIFKTVDKKFVTRAEYLEANKEKAAGKIYYATDDSVQSSTIQLYKDQGIDVVLLDSPIDVNFISFLEYKDSSATYSRVDADLSGLTDKNNVIDLDLDRLQNMFRDALEKKDLVVTLESLRDESIPAITIEEEQMRRYRDMSRVFGQGGMAFPSFVKLALNSQNPVIRKLNTADGGEDTKELCRQIFDLAEISRASLEPDALKKFIARSHNMLRKVVGE